MMGSTQDSHDIDAALALIQELKTSHPTITVLLRADPDFEATSRCHVVTPNPNCLGLARPTSAEEVCALIKFCTARSLPFVVRVGGHDCCARSQVSDALMIDLREMCHVCVDEAVGPGRQRTAKVGGGCLISGLLAELERFGLVTPVGTISSVGYLGWAYVGGYGPLSGVYGMGVDQIVGAKVVTAAGEVVEANEDLLKGIRGAAGALGVVVEVTIRVYPLDKLLAGYLLWPLPVGANHRLFVKTFLDKLRQLYNAGMPRALNPLAAVWENPHHTACILIMVTWASDNHDEGRRWIATLETLGPGPPAVNTIRPCTLLEGLKSNDSSLNPYVYGRCNTVTVRGDVSPGFVDTIAEYTANFGARGTGVCLHRFTGPVAGGDAEDQEASSVWGPREKHTMLEILSTTTDETAVEKAFAWACALKRAVEEAGPDDVVGGGWLAMTTHEQSDWVKVFGRNYEFLMELKRKWDPNNVFRNTVPRLPV